MLKNWCLEALKYSRTLTCDQFWPGDEEESLKQSNLAQAISVILYSLVKNAAKWSFELISRPNVIDGRIMTQF